MGLAELITVEPVLFMQMVGDTLTYVIYQNLFIDKICRTELKYGKEICDRYASFTDETIDESNEWLIPIKNEIQESSASFVLYNSLVENSLPMIIVLLLGVWSDAKKKRKPLFLFALFGKFFHSLGLLLNAYYMNWSPILLLLTSTLPYSIGGAKVVFHMATYSYIADSSIARHRTWRLSIAEAIFNVGAWIGLALGAYLFKEVGYICVFGTSVAFHFTAIIYTILFVPEISEFKSREVAMRYPDPVKEDGLNIKKVVPVAVRNGNNLTIRMSNYGSDSDLSDYTSESYSSRSYAKEKVDVESDPLIPSTKTVQDDIAKTKHSLLKLGKKKNTSVIKYMYGTFRPVFRKRSNHTRICVILMGIIMLLYGVSGNGEASMTYLFTRYKFQWREQTFSYWRIFDSVMTVLGLGIVMPLFTRVFKFSDTLTGAIAAVARFLAVSCIAFAPVPIYLFAGSVLDIFGVLMPIAARSLASKCVLTNERGRVFAFLGCIEAVARLVSVPLYSIVYSITLTILTSTIYYMSMSMYFIVIVIFSSLFIAKKMNWIEYEQDTKNPVAHTIVVVPNGTNLPAVRRNSLP